MNIPDYLKEHHNVLLDESQILAVESRRRKTVVLAVPGSGKTTVLTANIAGAVSNGSVPPERILAMSYNRESAAGLERKYTGFFGDLAPRSPKFSTLHAFSYSVFSYYARLKNRELPRLLGSDTQANSAEGFVRAVLREHTGEYPSEERISETLRMLALASGRMLTPEEMDKSADFTPDFAEFSEFYKTAKRRADVMDFDDLQSFCLAVFRSRPDILERFSRLYPHVYLDEAQDSSLLQLEIIKLLGAGGETFFAVGDEDQSIYGFRGASAGALLDLAETAHTIKLTCNYRSGDAITVPAQNVISRNKMRSEKQMKAQRSGGTLKITRLPGAQELVRLIKEIPSSLAPGQTAAVLYRNTASSVAPVAGLYTGGPLFYIRDPRSNPLKGAAADDILGMITFALTDDLGIFEKIYYKLGAYISKAAVEMLKQNLSSNENIFDLLAEFGGDRAATSKLRMLKYGFERMKTLAPAKILDMIFYDFEYLEYLRSGPENGTFESAGQRLRALEYIAENSSDAADFLQKTEQVREVYKDASKNRGAALTLSTVHSAKGLEFDRVYFIDLQDGIIPSSSGGHQTPAAAAALLEEERRLFYVGMTRAKSYLELITLTSYCGTSLSPSMFLEELTESPGTLAASLPGGQLLTHRYFGRGRVVGKNPQAGTFDILFEKGGKKTFVTDILKEEKIITLH